MDKIYRMNSDLNWDVDCCLSKWYPWLWRPKKSGLVVEMMSHTNGQWPKSVPGNQGMGFLAVPYRIPWLRNAAYLLVAHIFERLKVGIMTLPLLLLYWSVLFLKNISVIWSVRTKHPWVTVSEDTIVKLTLSTRFSSVNVNADHLEANPYFKLLL